MIFYKRAEREKVEGEKWTDFPFIFLFFVASRAIDGIEPQLLSFERSKIIFILFFFFSRSVLSREENI